MRHQALLLLVLVLESFAINDKNDAAYCKSKGLENCIRCPDLDNTDFGTLTTMCYECAEGHFWDKDHAARCVVIPEKRAISGWGRDCAECGKGNAWSSAETNCISCRYEASKCASSPCCTPDEDLGCNEHFELVDKKCVCKRGDNFKINGDCWCLDDLTYVAYENEEIVCKKCEDKCPTGCSDFTCPDGTYLDKDNADAAEQCKCKPVHYSCATGSGPLETDCITCNSDDGFSSVTVDGKLYCYCECCLIEADETCVEIKPAEDYSICKTTYPSGTNNVIPDCPIGSFYNGVECVQKEIRCPLGYIARNGECVPESQCPDDFIFSKGKCIYRCPSYTTWNPITQYCDNTPNCGDFSSWDNGVCTDLSN